jgi:hypothetical protein
LGKAVWCRMNRLVAARTTTMMVPVTGFIAN